ncbi:MAG: proline dehydrogenase [Chloroflexi bacterium]|nr:MAG: proline dehydrogenase [Chloroflexota bacterium]
MLRSVLISLSESEAIQKLIMHWPPAKKAAQRFVAGETLAQAIEAVRKLNEKGILASIDQLGENTTDSESAAHATRGILDILELIETSGVRANVSVKLSQIGMGLNDDLCQQNLSKILTRAKLTRNFIRIDMESAQVTEKTLNMYWFCIQNGFNNTGIVIQSYLFRSEKDIAQLNSAGGRVRLCKGAYKESKNVAFPHKADVDKNFDHLTIALFESEKMAGLPISDRDGKTPPIPALATHDEKRINFAKQQMKVMRLPKEAVEFQMLYGIRRDLQKQLVKEGYQVRVYVPFGTHWYPYFMRRLAERPANLWFFLSSYFHK